MVGIYHDPLHQISEQFCIEIVQAVRALMEYIHGLTQDLRYLADVIILQQFPTLA